jgi:hypothetical protein
MASIRKPLDGRWQAQYRVTPNGRRYTRTTRRKVDAQRWLDAETAKIQTGNWSDPKTARTTVGEWCDTWLAGYRSHRRPTVRAAEVHLRLVRQHFGHMRLGSVRPSHVRTWTAKLRASGYEASYVYALHARLAQVMSDAVHDGIIARSPCSRRLTVARTATALGGRHERRVGTP